MPRTGVREAVAQVIELASSETTRELLRLLHA